MLFQEPQCCVIGPRITQKIYIYSMLCNWSEESSQRIEEMETIYCYITMEHLKYKNINNILMFTQYISTP